MFCSKCGSKAQSAALYCHDCGAALPKATSETEYQTEQSATITSGKRLGPQSKAKQSRTIGNKNSVGKWDWVLPVFIGIIIAKLFSPIGGLAMLGLNYLLKPKIGGWQSVAVSGVIGLILAIVVLQPTANKLKKSALNPKITQTANSENSSSFNQFDPTTAKPARQFAPEVYQVYPDADAIVDSDEFKHWFNSQPPAITKGGVEKYSTTQRSGLLTALNLFKNKELCTQGQSFADPDLRHPDPNGRFALIDCKPNTWSYLK